MLLQKQIIETLKGMVDLHNKDIYFEISDEETKNLSTYLGVNKDTDSSELNIVRDMLVLTIANAKSIARNNNDYAEFELLEKLMTVVTTIIDNALYQLDVLTY